jgi:hypothetical protein
MQAVGFGCVPTPLDVVARDNVHRPLARLIQNAPPTSRLAKANYADLLDFVPDQGPTSSCVANAGSSACYLTGQAQGFPIRRPSRRHLYDLARYRGTPGKLVDQGSRADFMCEAAIEHGMVAEDRFVFDANAINDPPPFDTDVAGADAVGLDWWRASDDPEELAVALDRRQFPIIAIPVHQNFVDWSSDEPYSDVAGDFCGNHMLCLLGYEDTPSGLVFDVLNSWGPNWCRGGFIRMRGDFIKTGAFDRLLIRSAPAPR